MINLSKHVLTALSGVRLTPLIALMLFCPNRDVVWADMDHLARMWTWQLGGARRAFMARNLFERILQFVSFMTWSPEFRNVFYFRTGKPGMLLSMLCRPMSSLEIHSKMSVGPGLFVMHGNGTFVMANGIGENCKIYQQVTIGNVDALEVGRPTIGNNVTIYAGAKVVGKVKVGDNVTIAANSLVIKDVPSDVTVIGVPAVVIWKKKGSNKEAKRRGDKPLNASRPVSGVQVTGRQGENEAG
jgi:serine O-acetyltransferase